MAWRLRSKRIWLLRPVVISALSLPQSKLAGVFQWLKCTVFESSALWHIFGVVKQKDHVHHADTPTHNLFYEHHSTFTSQENCSCSELARSSWCNICRTPLRSPKEAQTSMLCIGLGRPARLVKAGRSFLYSALPWGRRRPGVRREGSYCTTSRSKRTSMQTV